MVFSVKEFWTSKDFECACENTKESVTKESLCCGVEVTEKKT
jgi:hypothetical protein